MHKLDRSCAPACLARFKHGRDNWSAVSKQDKAEIWAALEAMQGPRCAYCEAGITPDSRHIEHFVQKDRRPALTFAWDNLFGSCNREDSCGKHKDRLPPYDAAALIKPYLDDPDDYFVFTSLGTIAVRSGLSPAQQRRAEETLRVFNLDAEHGALRYQRQQAAVGYVQDAEFFAEMALLLPEADWLPALQKVLSDVSELPFATTIRHVLIGQR